MWGFRFLKYKKFWRGGFFHFSSLSWKVQSSISGKLRKALLRKYKQSFLLGKYRKSFLLRKYKYLFNIRARQFHFQKYKEFFRGGFFLIFFLGLGWEVQGSISRNIRKYNKNFLLRKYKSFFWENVRMIFLILEVESSISQNKRIFFRGWFF